MCIAVPLEVVEIRGDIALARYGNSTREVHLDLLEGVSAGDYVLVHAGFAIEKLNKEEAEKTLSLFREIADEIP
jgi:hydrogenase expression/formation protein HypC